MTDILPFLKSLISAAGLSAYEDPVHQLIKEKWTPLVDEISTSRVGSLHGLKRGTGAGRRPSILIASHMDAIGLMVRRIESGFLYVEEIGGVDPRILPGTPVRVHAKRLLPGVVVMPQAFALPEDRRNGVPALMDLVVDVGLPSSTVSGLVQVGDLVSFDTAPIELQGETLSGHSLDNRASVAALTVCLEELQKKKHSWDVWAVATVQEEETFAGGATSAYAIRPDIAIAVDVTHAKGPGADNWQTVPLGKGIALGWGANLHPFLHRRFAELAKRLEIPFVLDPMPGHSGTDAHPMQVAREGIPSALISIPLRYMHTAVELIAVKDVLRAGRLLAEFVAELEPDLVSRLQWEDDDARP